MPDQRWSLDVDEAGRVIVRRDQQPDLLAHIYRPASDSGLLIDHDRRLAELERRGA